MARVTPLSVIVSELQRGRISETLNSGEAGSHHALHKAAYSVQGLQLRMYIVQEVGVIHWKWRGNVLCLWTKARWRCEWNTCRPAPIVGPACLITMIAQRSDKGQTGKCAFSEARRTCKTFYRDTGRSSFGGVRADISTTWCSQWWMVLFISLSSSSQMALCAESCLSS